MKRIRNLFFIGLLFVGNLLHSRTNSSLEFIEPLKLARLICVLDCEIYEVQRKRITLQANGVINDAYGELKSQEENLYAKYDSLRTLLNVITYQNNVNAIVENQDLSWFIVIQDLLQTEGVFLNANERFQLVKDLPTSGGNSYNFKTENTSHDHRSYYVYAATEIILDNYFQNWKQMTYEKVQRLTVGINAFIKICRNYYIPFTYQSEDMNCGPTCLKIILDQWGTYYPVDLLSKLANLDETGTSFGDLINASSKLEVNTKNYKATYDELINELEYAVIAHWKNRHFVVVYGGDSDSVQIADPERGLVSYSRQEFCDNWLYGTEKKTGKGSILVCIPKPSFYHQKFIQ